MAEECLTWNALWRIQKFRGDEKHPFEVLSIPFNVLAYGGASNLWEYAIGAGTASGAAVNTYLDNANAFLGIGDSAVAAAAAQTDLQASSNVIRVGMDATFPHHTAGTSSVNATISFQATAGLSVANYAWNEVGLFNAGGLGGGRMINRKVISAGTKTSSQQWILTLDITLA